MCYYTVFALFYVVFEGNFQAQAPGGLYSEGRFNEGFFFLRYEFGGFIFGGAYFRNFKVFQSIFYLSVSGYETLCVVFDILLENDFSVFLYGKSVIDNNNDDDDDHK